MGDFVTKQVIGLPELEPYSSILGYLGMLVILFAFAVETRGQLSSRDSQYLWMMAIGSGLLGVRALHTAEWAFFILEGVWMGVALWALTQPPKPALD